MSKIGLLLAHCALIPLVCGASTKFKVRRIGHVRTEACAVADFNNDGRLDVIAGPNLYLAPEFRPVKVRDVTSNVNADGRGYADDFMNLPLDVNGDDTPELITGKRYRAHNGGDPDEDGPLGVYYYEFTPGPNPVFTKYAITYNEGIGTGMNIVPVDIDGDGDVDLVTTGKWGGPVIFENMTRSPYHACLRFD